MKIARLDPIRNEDIHDRYRVAPIEEKLQEGRLRWYGHVSAADNNLLANIDLNIEVERKRPKGWPKKSWLDKLDGDWKAG